jgi:glycosyltransferase involved in cell wall biosynthesis
LIPGRYILYVSRLEPENNAHLVIEAYEKVATDLPLVIVGGAPYAREYIAQLKRTKDQRVKFLGFVFGEDYRALQQNAYCYVHATEVGGTHPALIEAMGAGNCALTLATPENLEVIGDAGIVYESVDDLVVQLTKVLADPSMIGEYRHRAMSRVMQLYSWEQITDEYEILLARLAGDVSLATSRVAETVTPISYPVPAFSEEPPANVKVRRAARTLP